MEISKCGQEFEGGVETFTKFRYSSEFCSAGYGERQKKFTMCFFPIH